MVKYEYLVPFFVFVNISTVSTRAKDYYFITNHVARPEAILHADISRIAVEKNKEAFKVCKAARDYESIKIADDPDWPQRDARFFYVNLPSFNLTAISVIVCPTIPILYLLPHPKYPQTYTILIDTPEKRIRAAINKEYTPTTRLPPLRDLSSSTVEMIKSELITCQQMVSNDPRAFDITDDHFAKFLAEECDEKRILNMSALGALAQSSREELCSSAVKHINQLNREGQQPVEQFIKPGEVKIFGIADGKSSDATVNRRVALACSTLPRVYVLYQNLRLNEDMLILVVQ